MNRRVFAQFLALGAGWFGGQPAHAQEGGAEPKPKAAAPDAAEPVAQPQTSGPAPEPVTVTDFQVLAQARLPKPTYDYITTGSADEITLRENVAAFQRLKVLPPLLSGVSQADLTTTVLKQRVALPILL